MTSAGLISACSVMCLWSSVAFSAQSPRPVVISGATIIDGNGGAPLADGVIVIKGREIVQLGKRGEVDVPRQAEMIDAKGKYVVPGFIDTNVHLDMNFELFPLLVYGDYESHAKHSPALEGAQVALKHGITTILDTYGPLLTLIKLRDEINAGKIIGPRLLVAGNIIGWDGPLSPSESKRKPADIKPWEKQHGAWFTQGTGTVLTQLYEDEVRDAIGRYLDLGPDFIKIGVTTHDFSSPITLNFSSRVLKAIVDSAHARGLKVQVHSGSVEGHRESVDAGVDIITHAGSLYSQKMRPDYARSLCDSATYFAIFAHASLPPYEYLRGAVGAALADTPLAEERIRIIESITPDRDRSPRLEQPLETKLPGAHNSLTAFRRDNQQTLIDAGCKIVVATDSNTPPYEDLAGHGRMLPDMGIGTINAIEGLVMQLGMTPAQAIVAATKTGAAATGLLDRIGTLEAGKAADLLLLEANPLDDISNIRKISTVVRDGVLIDPATLPTRPKFYKR